MSERITLYGGPKNGEVMDWEGGDDILFAKRPTLTPLAMQRREPDALEDVTWLYRRSRRTPSKFVYQP